MVKSSKFWIIRFISLFLYSFNIRVGKKMDQGRQVFSVDLLERYATKNRGMITCMAAGNDVIVLGTSKGWIIRHDFGLGSSNGIIHFLSLVC